MKTFRIIQSGARGGRCLVQLLTIGLVAATSVQMTIKSQVVVPQPCKLQTYMAKDDNAIRVAGTNSEAMAATFDTAIAGMPGTRGFIDHEMLPVGNFSSMPLNSFVLAKLVNTGNSVTGNIEGIADSTSSSSGLGFNTTSGGDRHLQVYPLNNGPEGGVRLIFREDIFAFGCYISGREATKRPVEAVLTYRDGRHDILPTQSGPYPGGGLQFFGFVSDCPVAEIYFVERYNGEAAGERDIFTLDDIRYVTHVEWPVEKCEAIRYSAHDDGPPSGGEPNPLTVGWDHPRSKGEQKRFLNDIAGLGVGFTVDRVTFEADNGWAPVNGLGDLFIGATAPYPGTPNTSFPYTLAAFGNTGSYPSGDATGYTEYHTAHSRLLFNVYMNGHNATIDEPGIGDMDGSNDTDRGVNTTPGGNHFLEILPSESFEGGFRLEFARGTPAAGMYVQGTEAGKRRTSVTVDFLGGARRVYPDLNPGPNNVGGIEFLGFMAADISNRDCWIQAITFNQKWQGEPASARDIFSVDDIIYVIPGEDQPPPQEIGCIDFENLPLGKTYTVGDVFTWTSGDGSLVFNAEAVPFQWSDGRMFSGGAAEVEDDGLAGVSGQDLEVNNINLVLTPAGGPVSELSFSFGEYGGNINFAVNGDRRNVNNFSDLNGSVIGGAQVTVPAGGNGNDQGHVIITGLINEIMVGGQELYIDQICTGSEPPVAGHCIEFEDLNLGDSFSVGDRFNTSNLDGSLNFEVEALPYQWSDGTAFPGGTAMVGNNGMAGSSGNEMVVNNINLRFTSLSGPLPGLTFQFGEYGGNLNFAVNGDARNVDNFQDLNGLTVGGVLIDVPIGGHGNDMGEVVLTGVINDFTIGGQELFIDRICAGQGEPPVDPPVSDCVEFEELALGATYNVGDNFQVKNSSGSLEFEVLGRPFVWSDGNSTADGVATVEDQGNAGHVGHELNVNNINLQFTSQTGNLSGLSILFGEYGGNLNLSINGDFRNVENLIDLHNTIVGGVQVVLGSGGHGNDKGELCLFGDFRSFTIGGQEFYIDHICAKQGEPPVDPQNPTFAGRIIDGYIAGGRVFFDANFNGIPDEGEPSTVSDSKGHFELQIDIQTWDANMDGVIDSADGHLVVIGGVDIATGHPSRVKFSGPVGSTVLGPFSSLIDELLISQNGMATADAVSSVLSSLGLPQGIDPLRFDPFHAASEGDANALDVMVKAAMLQDTVVQIASMFAAAQGQAPDEWARRVNAAMVRLLIADFDLDLTNEVTLLSLIQGLNTEGETILNEGQVNLLVEMILKLNRLKLLAVDSTENDIPGKVEHMARIQHVAQGQSIEVLENAASGKNIPGDFLDDSNLDQAVEEAPSGDVFGTDTRPGTVSFQSASYLVNEDGSNLLALRLVRNDGNSGEVSVIIQRVDGSASAAAGDIMAGPWQGVFADGQTAIIVNLTDIIIDDAVPEGDESFTLRLALPDNHVAGLALGTETEVMVTIQDNDESAPEPDPATLTMSKTHLTVSGTPGASYEILVSNDLKSWTLWKSVTLDNASGGQVSLPVESRRQIGFFSARPVTF